MLVLTRKEGQWIDLRNRSTGEVISIVNSRCSSRFSRIGVHASGDWDIARREIDEQPESVPVLEVSDIVESDIG